MNKEQLDNLIIKTLKEEGDKIKPDARLLSEILSKIDAEVTTSDDNRLMSRGDIIKSLTYGYVEDKGRALGKDQINIFMAINWKLVLGVVILGIVAGLSYYQFVLKPTPIEVAQVPTGAVQQAPVAVVDIIPATGDVDDAVLALLNDADAEASILADIDNDANLLIADSQAIDDFGQSYNEEF